MTVFDFSDIKIKELAISGGGIKGYAYLGALVRLEQLNLLNSIEKISCVSIGSMFAVSFLLGYTMKELMDIFFDLDIRTLKDIDISDSVKRKSILKGEEYRKMLKYLYLQKYTKIPTLKELYDKTGIDLIIVTVNLSQQRIMYLNHKTEPDLDVYTATLMSSSIPYFFPPVKWNKEIYIDGGILDNNPIQCLSLDAWGICERIKNKKQKTKQLDNFFDYSISMIAVVYNYFNIANTKLFKNWIEIECEDIHVTSFNITKDQKYKLIQNGIEAVNKHCNN